MNKLMQQSMKKYCIFYASDVHLSVMLLPYINREINDQNEITAIFEKIRISEIEKIIEKINTNNKNKILNIKWICAEDENNLKESLSDLLNINKKNTIIVGGCQNFINKINEEVLNATKDNVEIAKVVDCYNIEENIEDIQNLTNKYDGIINTLSFISNEIH